MIHCCPQREGWVNGTQPMIFSADDSTDVGSDAASPVSDDYSPQNSAFTGRIRGVRIDLGKDADDADHLITLRSGCGVAVTRQ